jgi:succinoglycan biosynthesis transport protein ExoP
MSEAVSAPASPKPRTAAHSSSIARSPGALFTPRQLLYAVRRHWLLALVLGTLLGGGAAAIVWLFLPPGPMTAVRQLHIAAVNPSVAFGSQEAMADFNTFKQTQSMLLRSRPVLNAALRSPKLANSELIASKTEPIEWLEKEIQVRGTASPEIIQIQMQGSPEQMPEMRLIVDAVTEAFLREIVDKDLDRMRKKLEQLREIASRYDKKLKGIRLSMRTLREQAGTGNPENLMLKQKQALLEYSQASQELSRLRSELRSLRTQLVSLEDNKLDIDTVSDAELDAYAEREPSLAQLAAEIATLERRVETEAARAVQGRNAPLVRSLLAEVARKQSELERRKTQMRGSVLERIKAEKQRNAVLGVTSLRQRIQYMENLEKLLVKDCERLNRESKQLHQRALDLEDFKYDLDEAEAMYKTINERAEKLTIEMEAPSRISDLNREEGAIIQRPDEFNRKLRFASLAGAAGLGLVVMGLGLLEVRVRRLTSPLDLSEQLGLNVLGTMPLCRGAKQQDRSRRSQHLRESVDGIRTLLLHIAETDGLKVVLVGSSVPGEGKTTLACHLAISLARAGQRTLLIDGDLRKPTIHKIFGCKEELGLCEVLRDEIPLEKGLYETDQPTLHLMPAGRLNEAALGALADTKLKEVLHRLRASYDLILIDSSPLIAVPDSLMLARQSDGVVLSTMQEATRMMQVQSVVERLRKVSVRLLGVVVHGTRDVENYGYRYYHRYAKREHIKASK